MITINDAYEIVATGLNDPEQPRHPLAQPPGPNSWDSITDAEFGENFDFELYEIGETKVFYPVSKAALQWAYRHLPADCDRWRGLGFKVEAQWIDLVCRQARLDKLISLDDALHEEEQRGMV